MKTRFFLLAATVLLTSAVLADDPPIPVAPERGKEVMVIEESKEARVFNAAGQDVTINGSHNQVSIKGTCHALTVSGNNNVVTVASVVSISVSGTDNEVSWSAASGGEKPQVTDVGKRNQVAHAKVE